LTIPTRIIILEEREVLYMADYTIQEAAKASGMAENTIRRWIKSGKIPAEKEDGMYRISKEVIQGYFVDRGIKVKNTDTQEVIQPGQADDRLYQEMRERIEEMKKRIEFLEEELRNSRNLIDRLTIKALPGSTTPDTRGAFQRMKEWFMGKKEK
jgi:excisionase family DNA binding protein